LGALVRYRNSRKKCKSHPVVETPHLTINHPKKLACDD
jgi:hypothetical protein